MDHEEKLLEFLYVAPVALIQFDGSGNVTLANPRVAQLFNRYAPGGYFANFLTFLDDVLPEFKKDIVNFPHKGGQIMENKRVCLQAPSQLAQEELWMDVTVMKQDDERYIASLNNVTDQVVAENERYVSEQYLTQLLEKVNKHVAFTLDPNGIINSWNITGETYITDSPYALGKVLSQLFPISNQDNSLILAQAKEMGQHKTTIQFADKSGESHASCLYVSGIHDQRDKFQGFSVVLTLGE